MISILCTILVFLTIFIFIVYKFYDFLVRLPLVGKYTKKHVLITGCSSGFGFDAVKRLDRMGCKVFAGVRNEAAAQKIRDACSSQVTPVFIDIAKPESVQACYDQIVKLLPEGEGLWGLVNNAGVGSKIKGPTDWHTLDVYQDSIDVNVLGTINTTLTFLPLLKKSKGGARIVNVTSALGTIYAPCYSAYTMTKRAVEAFSDTLRVEMCYFNISTSIVEPGSFFTMINDEQRAAVKAKENMESLSEEIKEQYGSQYLEEIASPRPHQKKLGSSDLTPVIDTYVHALFALYPRARYVVGKSMKKIMFLHWILPDWLYDHFAKKNAPIPAVAKQH